MPLPAAPLLACLAALRSTGRARTRPGGGWRLTALWRNLWLTGLAGLALGLLNVLAVRPFLPEPSPQDARLAADAAHFCADALGHLPRQTRSAPTPGGRGYTFRPATGGLVVLVLYGVPPQADGPAVRAAAQAALARFPALRAVVVTYYAPLPFTPLADGSWSAGRDTYWGRMTVHRPAPPTTDA